MTTEECKHKLVRVEMKIKDPSERKALFMAIASLEAWEKVRQEVKQEIESNWGFERIGEENILAIIDKHLREMENG